MQDFYPTPGTASTVMYYTGIDPLTMKKVFVATDPEQKKLQRALLQCNRPENAALVRKALRAAGREDLIGFAPTCLVRPEGAQHAPRVQNAPKTSAGKHEKVQNTPKRVEKSARSAREKAPARPAGSPKGGVMRDTKPQKGGAVRGGKSAQGTAAGRPTPKNQAPKRRK